MTKRKGGMASVLIAILLVIAVFWLTTPNAIPTPLRPYTCVSP